MAGRLPASMSDVFFSALLVFDQILSAGNSITAFSLLLYALTFNLRERVARTFALVLACLALVYFGDVLAGLATGDADLELWLRLQWVGISFLPSTVLHLSDAILSSTGRPSRGRRQWLIRMCYLASGGILILAGTTSLLAGGVQRTDRAGYLQPGPLFPLFLVFFAGAIGITASNYLRAYRRCLTADSRRRMGYLVAGSIAPVLGGFPFLMLLGPSLAAVPFLFWGGVAIVNIGVAILLVLMAYAIAYFGVSFPDRVVKARLFQWIMRGPVVASSVLAVMVVVNRTTQLLGLKGSGLASFAMVATLLLLQFVITLIRPPVERWLFYGADREDVARLHLLEERLLTTGDLRQFLESVLNAACDVTGASGAFIAALSADGLGLEVAVGTQPSLESGGDVPSMLRPEERREIPPLGAVFTWESSWLIPLHARESMEMVGLLGLQAADKAQAFPEAQAEELSVLAERASVALTDRLLQREVFSTVDRLVPQVEAIQRMRVAARYAGVEALTAPAADLPPEADLVNMVREALGHYWGGPRLTSSPLLGLRVVREALDEHEGNPVNALRSILKRGIERTRPDGERRFTGEWMLYNILEMKFLEGRKVRDVALRLAMSEADLYRKQRLAIEAVAQAVADMEREAAARKPRRSGRS
jgi:MFS family permease